MLVTIIFLLFPTIFSILLKSDFNFSVAFILLSANAFNSEQSKILSLGKELKRQLLGQSLQSRLFLTLYKKPCENIVGKGENAGNHHFSPFPTLFSILPKTNFNFSNTSILSSASALNLDQFKILSFG